MLLANEKQEIIKKHQQKEGDTGSAEVQIALLTADIAKLTPHFQINKQDHHSRRGLLRKIKARDKLLAYLRSQSMARYRQLIQELGLRR